MNRCRLEPTTGVLTMPAHLLQGGGILGIVCAALAYYTAFTGLMTPGHGIFVLPNPKLS